MEMATNGLVMAWKPDNGLPNYGNRSVYETRRHKTAPMSGNSKHSKNKLKIYVKNCAIFLYVVDARTILFSFIFS